ncbi:MAG TPA: choice-of-anchor Q domain-containing protein, partial [Solirubrobacter sp.]|nr:choice-of-anchor Q domain-containing protein [Solirubrobacter sp.]
EFIVQRSVTLRGVGADKTMITGDTGRTFIIAAPDGGPPPTVVMEHLHVAFGRTSGSGGNILNEGNLTLDHVRVSGGFAGDGAGVANFGSLTVRYSAIDSNISGSGEGVDEGGGIYSDTAEGGALRIHDSTIAFNMAERGGGVAVTSGSKADLERVTLARNMSNLQPGGLLVGRAAGVEVRGSLVAGNTAEPFTLALAAPAPIPSNCDPEFRPIDRGGNLSNTNECFQTAPADPLLSDTLNFELGETPLLPIPPDSPAVDLIEDCGGTDQRDLPRPQGNACDAGAYEVAAPVVIESGPAGVTTTNSVTFTFSSEQPGVVFQCRLDGPGGEGEWLPCTSPHTYTSLPNGSYTFHVRAAGSSTQASRAFTVALATPQPQPQPSPAQTPTPTPTPSPAPEPVFRKSVSIKPTKGRVKIRLPGTKRYVDLENLETVPFGASIDARKGRVRLYAARNRRGDIQAASFYSGVFRVVQRGSYIELQLRGPKPVCGSRNASASEARPKKRKKARKRRLWGSGKGRFRTRGRFSAATVRGTKWLVQDSCRSTTTVVRRGVVTVRDFKRKRTITLRAGDRYVARRR